MSTYSISSTEYGAYEQIANNIRSDISGYLGIPIYQIHWRDFKNFLEKRFNVTFFPNDSYHGIVAKKYREVSPATDRIRLLSITIHLIK